MKRNYLPATFNIVSLEGSDALLIGSRTTTPVTVKKEDVTVSDYKDDQIFTENNFGDISF